MGNLHGTHCGNDTMMEFFVFFLKSYTISGIFGGALHCNQIWGKLICISKILVFNLREHLTMYNNCMSSWMLLLFFPL